MINHPKNKTYIHTKERNYSNMRFKKKIQRKRILKSQTFSEKNAFQVDEKHIFRGKFEKKNMTFGQLDLSQFSPFQF